MSGVPVEVVLLAVGAAASPLPVVVLLVLLLTPQAVVNGVAFTSGWATGLLALGAGTVAFAGAGVRLDEGGSVVSAVEVLVGIGLLIVCVRQWRRRPAPGQAVAPRWLEVADGWTARRAFGMGIVCLVVSPKNVALTVTAAGVVASITGRAGDRLLALGAFAVVGSAALLVPVALRLWLGPRAAGVLAQWRRWLVANGTRVVCALLVTLGSLLVVRGAS